MSEHSAPAPLPLPPNPVHRFYRGGEGIDALRGVVSQPGSAAPEDWVASTTTSLGSDSEGLSRLADGRLLRDLIAADPVGYLGPEHAARWGANTAVLIKLLDAGERLAAHFHPGRAFARQHLNSRFGKTEAWIILAAEPGAQMQLGVREPIDLATLERWVREQDSEQILAALRTVPVATGDVLFVPAGTIHTIGAGITLVELQEPSDMSVVLEWRRFNVTGGEEHLHLGWEQVLSAAQTDVAEPFHLQASPPPPGSSIQPLLPPEADPYFRAQRLTLDGSALTLDAAYSVLIALRGELTITSEHHHPLSLKPGEAALIPHGTGTTTVAGQGTGIRCLPPAADSGEGNW